jgi:hypothetical protein
MRITLNMKKILSSTGAQTIAITIVCLPTLLKTVSIVATFFRFSICYVQVIIMSIRWVHMVLQVVWKLVQVTQHTHANKRADAKRPVSSRKEMLNVTWMDTDGVAITPWMSALMWLVRQDERVSLSSFTLAFGCHQNLYAWLKRMTSQGQKDCLSFKDTWMWFCLLDTKIHLYTVQQREGSEQSWIFWYRKKW